MFLHHMLCWGLSGRGAANLTFTGTASIHCGNMNQAGICLDEYQTRTSLLWSQTHFILIKIYYICIHDKSYLWIISCWWRYSCFIILYSCYIHVCFAAFYLCFATEDNFRAEDDHHCAEDDHHCAKDDHHCAEDDHHCAEDNHHCADDDHHIVLMMTMNRVF